MSKVNTVENIETKHLILKNLHDTSEAKRCYDNFLSSYETAKYMLWKPTDLFNREYGSNGERPKENESEMISNLNDEQVDKLLELLEKRKQEKEQEETIQEVKQEEPEFDSYEWEREQRRKRRKEKDFEM